MKGRKVPSNSSLGFVYGIGSVIYLTGNADYNTLSDNKIIYGYNGIYTTTASSGITITENVIDTSGSSGIYMSSQTGLVIDKNSFNMGDFGPSSGHYVSYGMRIESSPSMQITNNKLQMLAKNGQVVRAIMLANTTSPKSKTTLVANNWIMNSGGTGDCTGLALYNCKWLDMYYNSVVITAALKGGACYYHYSAYTNKNIRLVNNILVNTGGGFVYNFPGSNTGDMASINYNACYHNGTYFGKYNNTDYSTFSAWKSNARRDTNSVYADPGFTSTTDLHVSNISLNGKALPYSAVTKDIDGESRNGSAPDIGADEFFPVQLDAGVTKLDSPATFCAGSRSVKVTFQNYGIDTIKGLEIAWSVNGTAQKTYSFSGKIPPGGSSSSIALGSYTFSANTPYTFKIWTAKPNNSSDGKTVNDTLKITRLTGMTGTYSIGVGSSYDFQSFNDAISEITARGLCGATTFNVADGIYREQITLVQLDGMGPTAPLTFQGSSKDSSKAVVSLASTTATGNNNAAIQLRGADNCTFKWITFKRTGTNTYAQVVHILNGAHDNTFSNCAMIATAVTSNNASGVNIWSDQSRDTGNVFLNNYIKHGTYNMLYTGVDATPETGTVVQGNTFDSAYVSAVHLLYNDGAEVRNNTFKNVRNTLSGTFNIGLTYCDKEIVVEGNYIADNNAERGISLENCDSKAKEPGLVANNMLVRRNGVGVYANNTYNQRIVFNSLSFRGTNTGNIGIQTGTSGVGGLQLLNNNIAMDSGQVFIIPLKSHVSRSDYNNYITNSPRLGRFSGKWYKTLDAYKKGGKTDTNSLSMNPYYVSATDLHARNTSLNGAGTPVVGVGLDYDGQTRNSTLPDIGADEFDAQAIDAGIADFSEPKNGTCEGQQDIRVVLKNFGTNNLVSATIEWSMNGTAQTPYSWSGTLKPLETDTLLLATKMFKASNPVTFKAWTSDPNSGTDGFTFNDAFETKRAFSALPYVNGGTDKEFCYGDSARLGLPPSSAVTYTWFDASNTAVSTESRIYVKPTSSTHYVQQVVQKTTGCTNRDTVYVVVNAGPSLYAGRDTSICQGDGVVLGQSAVTGNSYAWSSNPSGFVSTKSNPSVMPQASTVYTLVQTIDLTGCSATGEVSISVVPSPTVVLSGDTLVCAGTKHSYLTTDNPGNTYTWTVVGGTVKSGLGSHSVDIRWDNAGKASLQVIESNNMGCSDTGSLALDISAYPVAAFSFSGRCVGHPVNFTDESTDNENRTWDFGNGKTATKAKPTTEYSQEGSYTVRLIAGTAAGCADTAEKTLTVGEKPAVAFELKTNVCEGDDLGIVNNTTGNATYAWDFGNGNSTDKTPGHAYENSGTYKVWLLADNLGCRDSASKTVVVQEGPNASFTLELTGATVKVSPDNISLPGYEWDFGDGTKSSKKNETHTYAIKKGWVYVRLTVTGSNGCTNEQLDSVYIDVTWVGELPRVSASIYPNPSFGTAHIDLEMAQGGIMRVSAYDMGGRLVLPIFDGKAQIGINKLVINTKQLDGGCYVLVVELEDGHKYRWLFEVAD
jgi:PKD repeat protein